MGPHAQLRASGSLLRAFGGYLALSPTFRRQFFALFVFASFSAIAVWNAALRATPRISDDSRYSLAFASRTIFLIAGMS